MLITVTVVVDESDSKPRYRHYIDGALVEDRQEYAWESAKRQKGDSLDKDPRDPMCGGSAAGHS